MKKGIALLSHCIDNFVSVGTSFWCCASFEPSKGLSFPQRIHVVGSLSLDFTTMIQNTGYLEAQFI